MDTEHTETTAGRLPADAAAATFAAGCFWGVEHVFSQVPGVLATRVGFMGGTVENPSYRRVCAGDTNHAEVVQVVYDPKKIDYETLVRVFFKTHNPTTPDRQGPDVGTQYRSAIFYHTPDQKAIAEKVKAAVDQSGEYKHPVVTEITEAGSFWEAEEYHQQYVQKHPERACHTSNIREILREIKDSFVEYF